MKRIFFTVVYLGLVYAAQAQIKVGDNPTVINSSAVLDVESTNKGLLFPRVALTGANAAAPLSAFVAGMTVYNTATAGTGANAVVPGLYYCDGTKWVPTAKDYVEDPTLGSIAVFPYSALPSGYLECNGAAVSRTTYAALFAKIGTTYGAGDGSTTFNLPDLRGEFVRGWDNGRGVDAGRALATFQSGATQLPGTAFTGTTSSYTHNHGVGNGSSSTNTVNAGSYGLIRRSSSGEGLTVGGTDNIGSGNEPDALNVPRVIPNDVHSHTVTLSGGGDAETRPRNVAMVYAIKAVESILVPSSTSSAIDSAAAAAAAASEPWYKVGTAAGATANTDNVYITGNVGIGTSTPNASAALDISSSTQGVLFPRMTQAQRTTIGSPAVGLLVYQTDAASGFYYYTGSVWAYLASTANTQPDYLSLAWSSAQPINSGNTLVPTSVVATNNTIVYNSSTGFFTLIGGKTYELEADITGGWNCAGWFEIRWVDATSNTSLNSAVSLSPIANTDGGNHSGRTHMRLIYTPVSNQTVKLRYMSGATGCYNEVESGIVNVIELK